MASPSICAFRARGRRNYSSPFSVEKAASSLLAEGDDYLEMRSGEVPENLREAAEACDDPESLEPVTTRAHRAERLEDIQFPGQPNAEDQTDKTQ